ncbi:hypothetical protein IQ06DRAFT_213830 [Phaeosphaeriaceae sp. SRC1lsM3a]|nr:hypothetical protein IQ06DRAFT_213830 [Stagonospora sp. SRC1lsM3a]
MPRILQTIFAALAVAPVAFGHTWIEQLRNVNDKGKYVGEYGYPRGMVSKTDPGYNGFSMNFEIPAYQGKVFIQNDTMLCHKEQRQQKQSQDKYPRLQAVPGGFIAMRYMENGHITLPQNQKGKPEKAGTIFIYGTTQPKQDEKIANVLRWTEDGKGGDGRGILIAMNDFDDGRCYETNNSPIHNERVQSSPNYAMGQAEDGPGTFPLFCESNVQLPKSATMGKPYTFYWVWQWNTASGGIDPSYPKGKDEYYSTCIDVDVVSKDVALATDAKPKFALGQQDAMSKAVKDWSSRTALMTNALQGEVGPIFGGGKQTPAPSAPGAAPSAKPSAPQAPAPAPSGNPPKASDEPAIPTVTGRPGRPGAAPTSKSYDGPVVTVTDTVFMTVTAPAASKSPADTPGQLPGFNMRNPNGAKFRGMFR